MSIGGSFALGKGAARGLGSLWPLWFPAEIIGLALDGVVGVAWWGYLVTFVSVSALWYFVVGRLPGRLRARTIRTFVPGALVATIRLDEFVFGAVTTAKSPVRSGRPRFGGTALVATGSDLQIWLGRISEPYPGRTIAWSAAQSFTALGGASSSRIALNLDAGEQLVFSVASAGILSLTFRRGRARGAFIAQLEALRPE